MAKVVAKKTVAVPKKTVKTSAPVNIVKVTEGILEKLKTLNVDSGLQSDIVWCLGSYGHDKNPIGLYEKATLALEVFKAEHAKKTKGITTKFISDLEKVLATK
jgi:hypothetical protein